MVSYTIQIIQIRDLSTHTYLDQVGIDQLSEEWGFFT